MVRIVVLRILETYFRHRWLYLAPIVLMIALAGVYVYKAEPKYQSQGVLFVQNESLLSSLNDVRASSGSWWVTPAQATTNQLNELLKTDAFIRAVIEQTDLETAEMSKGPAAVAATIASTRKNIWAYTQGEKQLLVAALHEDPQISYQLVNGVIQGYIQWQINAQRAESLSAQAFFADIIDRYEADLIAARDEMRGYLLEHPEPIRGDRTSLEQMEIARLQSVIDLAASRYASALDKEENAELALAQIESDARQNYLVIDAPELPKEPLTSLKSTAINVGVFLAAGVALSVAAILGAAILDRTFRFNIDVENRLGLPVLAVVPDVAARRGLFARLFRRKTEPEAVAQAADQPAAVESAPAEAMPEYTDVPATYRPRRRAKPTKAEALS